MTVAMPEEILVYPYFETFGRRLGLRFGSFGSFPGVDTVAIVEGRLTWRPQESMTTIDFDPMTR